jgi:hypothetical protein
VAAGQHHGPTDTVDQHVVGELLVPQLKHWDACREQHADEPFEVGGIGASRHEHAEPGRCKPIWRRRWLRKLIVGRAGRHG